MLTIRPLDAATPAGLSPPDIIWAGAVGDFAQEQLGGHVASDPIRTAIIMLLFTDAACDPGELRFEHNGDRRGWVGDGFAVDARRGEQALGSTLWLLRRSKLDETVALMAEAEAVRALQPLVRQKIATSVTAKAVIAGARDRLELAIDLKSRDGRPLRSERFDILWKARD